MKAKNIAKYCGKEVIIKAPLQEVTNYNGQLLNLIEITVLQNTPLVLASHICAQDGDVCIENRYGKKIWVHRKFIKVKKDTVPTETDINP